MDAKSGFCHRVGCAVCVVFSEFVTLWNEQIISIVHRRVDLDIDSGTLPCYSRRAQRQQRSWTTLFRSWMKATKKSQKKTEVQQFSSNRFGKACTLKLCFLACTQETTHKSSLSAPSKQKISLLIQSFFCVNWRKQFATDKRNTSQTWEINRLQLTAGPLPNAASIFTFVWGKCMSIVRQLDPVFCTEQAGNRTTPAWRFPFWARAYFFSHEAVWVREKCLLKVVFLRLVSWPCHKRLQNSFSLTCKMISEQWATTLEDRHGIQVSFVRNLSQCSR